MRFPKLKSRPKARLLPLLFFAALARPGLTLAEEAKEGGKAESGALTTNQREFNEKTSRMNSLTTRIEEDERQFMELVHKKADEKNTVEKQRIIKQMLEATKDRNNSAEEYNKIKSDLTLRYPNQGEHLNRRYQTQAKKTSEEMEGAAGLDELLTRAKKIIEKKFAPFDDETEAKKKPKAQAASPEQQPEQRLRLEK